jgi:sugar phosphate isomerase/epimerase
MIRTAGLQLRMRCTRRDLGRLALAGSPLLLLRSTSAHASARQGARPDSRWAGVHVGMNVPYNFGGRTMPMDEILDRSVQLGVSALELRAQPVEAWLGAPVLPPTAKAPARGSDSGLLDTEKEVLRESYEQAQKTFAARLAEWRASADVGRLAAFRRQYEDAGVHIEIVKWDDLARMTDAELDYAFRASKALGARALSTEISAAGPPRVAPFAAQHELMVGFHGHASTGAAAFEEAIAQGEFVGVNLDIGHWVAGGHGSPLPFLRQHAARITHIHVKDRKADNGPNTPFGEGDTPIREVLQAMRDNKWGFQATIEFEYRVPDGSDRMQELARALAYCRECLLGT